MMVSNLRDDIKNGFVKPHHLAMWRSDIDVQILYHVGIGTDGRGINTGDNYIAFQKTDYPVNSIGLDKEIENILNIECSERRIKLIKLDCEFAEYPILFTSKKLSMVDYICGEYHPGNLPESHKWDETFWREGINLLFRLARF